MTIPLSSAPSLLALDWGTTMLRAYQLGSVGEVVETRSEPWGILQVRGDFAGTYERMTSEWRSRWPGLQTIACGMIGSTAGWREVPYASCPAGVEELADLVASAHDEALHIVPGVALFGDLPNMMRGEETQIVGVLELHPELGEDSLLVLPGTHSKWVRVRRGQIVDFTTCITGELFAALRDHTILGRAARDSAQVADRATVEAAFARGVIAARAATAGIAPLLFSARSMVLAQRVEPEASLEYLSGLLIGDEIRCGLADGGWPSALLGDPVLCARYVAALRLFGAPPLPVYEEAAARGLWEIARRAGLLAAPS